MDLSKKTIVNHGITKGVYSLFIEKLKNSPERAIIIDDLKFKATETLITELSIKAELEHQIVPTIPHAQ